MKIVRTLLSACATIAVLFAACTTEAAHGPPVPKDHPRVYITAKDLPELRERIKRSPYKEIWEDVRRDRDSVSRALAYLLEGDQKAGRQAIDDVLQELYRRDAFEEARSFGSGYHKAAAVYDWCYPLLTAEEKQRFIHQFITLPNKENKHGNIYIGYPARMTSNSATGHQSEGYLLTTQLPAGLAIYDENKTLYDAAAKLFFERFVPARNYQYAGHTHHQGTFYGVGRFHYDLEATWMYRALGAGDILSNEQQFMPYYYLYMTQGDGTAFHVGDAIAEGDPTLVYAKVGSFYGDPYLLGLSSERLRNEFGRLFDLLYRDHETQPRPITQLPLTKYFPSPGGQMVARTGWDISPESRDAVIFMHLGEAYFGNHQHYASARSRSAIADLWPSPRAITTITPASTAAITTTAPSPRTGC